MRELPACIAIVFRTKGGRLTWIRDETLRKDRESWARFAVLAKRHYQFLDALVEGDAPGAYRWDGVEFHSGVVLSKRFAPLVGVFNTRNETQLGELNRLLDRASVAA